jgi:hypothetical protein
VSDPEGKGLRPTVIQPPAGDARSKRKGALMPSPVEAAPAAVEPTVIAGMRRHRIPVAPRELQALAPGTAPAVCAAAVRLLDGVVVQKLTERKAVLWGHEVQKAYGDQVTGTLALAQDPLVEQARSHVARMLEILGAIDLMAVCGHDNAGLVARVFKPVNGKIDTPAELGRALSELRLLLDRMNAAIARLLGLADKLRQHAAAMARVAGDIAAAALAAEFLSRHVTAPDPHVAQRFAERAMSLTATLAQVGQTDAVRRIQIEQPLQLIGAIQNVALVSLPGFIAGLAALLTLAKTQGASPTEARDMSYQLRHVIHRLNTQEGFP